MRRSKIIQTNKNVIKRVISRPKTRQKTDIKCTGDESM
jgi:hypothetical protein